MLISFKVLINLEAGDLQSWLNNSSGQAVKVEGRVKVGVTGAGV